MKKASHLLCPSAPCKEGANVIGIVMATDGVALLNKPIPVDKEFMQRAQQGRAPEKRFRFSYTCVQSGCSQWKGSKCGLIETVVQDIRADQKRIPTLPNCTIRKDCRWFHQEGAAACAVCPLIITNDGT